MPSQTNKNSPSALESGHHWGRCKFRTGYWSYLWTRVERCNGPHRPKAAGERWPEGVGLRASAEWACVACMRAARAARLPKCCRVPSSCETRTNQTAQRDSARQRDRYGSPPSSHLVPPVSPLDPLRSLPSFRPLIVWLVEDLFLCSVLNTTTLLFNWELKHFRRTNATFGSSITRVLG